MNMEAFLDICYNGVKAFTCKEVLEICFGDARDVQFCFLAVFGEEEVEKAFAA